MYNTAVTQVFCYCRLQVTFQKYVPMFVTNIYVRIYVLFELCAVSYEISLTVQKQSSKDQEQSLEVRKQVRYT